MALHLGLGRLNVLYDDNSFAIDGDTHLFATEDVLPRFEAYGHSETSLANMRQIAQGVIDKSSIIKVKTKIGPSISNTEGPEVGGTGCLNGSGATRGCQTERLGIPDSRPYQKIPRRSDGNFPTVCP